MKQLVQISHISAIQALKILPKLLGRLRLGIFFKELHHDCNLRPAQLLVIYRLAARAKTAVHSIASKVSNTLE
jgi:hypothetical protein